MAPAGLGGFLLAEYNDLNQHGTMPLGPVYSAPGFLFYRNDSFEFRGSFSPAVVQQPVPVPEPATMALVGIGLAVMGGREWRRRKPCRF